MRIIRTLRPHHGIGQASFSTFKIPKSTDSVSLTMTNQKRYHHLQEHFNQRDNQAHLDKEHNKDIMDAARHMASRDMSHNQPKTSGYEHRPFTSGNHGNNMPPSSPRQKYAPLHSCPRHPPSHHEAKANEEISSEALMRFEQDEEAQ